MPNDGGLNEGTIGLFADHPEIIKWFGILLVVGYALKLAAQMSETVSHALGRLGKRWHRQGEATTREARRRVNENAKVADLVDQVTYLRGRLEKVESTYRSLRERMDLKDEWIVYDIDWHANNERHGAALGWEWPLPHHMSYDEFVAARKAAEEDPAP